MPTKDILPGTCTTSRVMHASDTEADSLSDRATRDMLTKLPARVGLLQSCINWVVEFFYLTDYMIILLHVRPALGLCFVMKVTVCLLVERL